MHNVIRTTFFCFRDHGIEIKIVKRFEYTKPLIDWADVIFTTGGDGTFLLAASRIQNCKKPIIGINTDPTRFATQTI